MPVAEISKHGVGEEIEGKTRHAEPSESLRVAPTAGKQLQVHTNDAGYALLHRAPEFHLSVEPRVQSGKDLIPTQNARASV